MQRDRIFGLDFLRAMAIIMVLAANAIYILPDVSPVVGQLASLSGFFGLEIFLVLSGFLLAQSFFPIYNKSDFGYADVLGFLKRRFLRIWPLYALALLANLCIAALMDYSVTSVWKYFLFLQNVASPIPNFFPESWGLPMIFYGSVALPTLLFLLSRILKVGRKNVVVIFALVVLIIIFLINKWIYQMNTGETNLTQWDVSLKTVLIYRLDSFFIGALIGWFCVLRPKLPQPIRFLFAVIGIFGIAFLSVGVGILQLNIDRFGFFWNVLYLPIASTSVGLLLPMLMSWKTHIRSKPILFLSLCSYALYLIHFSFVLQLLEHYVFANGCDDYTNYFPVAYLVLTLCVGALFCKVENLFRFGFGKNRGVN